MQPQSHEPHRGEEPGRIIYIGDVRRRRRGVGGRLPHHRYLLAMAVVAVVSWLVWAVVFFTVPPSHLMTFIAFFVPLSVALAATGAFGAHVVASRLQPGPDPAPSVRRGVLVSLLTCTNLIFLAVHGWSPGVLVATAIAAVVLDVASAHNLI